MNLFSFWKTPPVKLAESPGKDTSPISFLQFSRPELPVVKESSRGEWIDYGARNDYPAKLVELLSTSPIHNAIIATKAKMLSGAGIQFDYDVLEPRSAALITEMMESVNPELNLQQLVDELAFNWQVFGAFAIEVIWSVDLSRVVEAYPVSPLDLRVAKPDDRGVVHGYYMADWSKRGNVDPIYIPRFDPVAAREKKQYRQLIYKRNARPGVRHYGSPTYESALAYIAIDGHISEYHLSALNNGFAPSFIIKFYEKPSSEEAKSDIARALDREHAGSHNVKRAFLVFSDGKENAPDIEPIESSNLDQQLMILQDQTTAQIISAHRVTSPMLLGVAVPGKLGYSNELEPAFKIFDSTVISPDRKLFESTLEVLARAWGVESKCKVNQFNPLG